MVKSVQKIHSGFSFVSVFIYVFFFPAQCQVEFSTRGLMGALGVHLHVFDYFCDYVGERAVKRHKSIAEGNVSGEHIVRWRKFQAFIVQTIIIPASVQNKRLSSCRYASVSLSLYQCETQQG